MHDGASIRAREGNMMTMAEFKEVYGLTKTAFLKLKEVLAKNAAEYKNEIGAVAYAKFKEGLDRRPYLARIPKLKDGPAGVDILHNQIVPLARMIGRRCLRIWGQSLDESYPLFEVCSCGWAPELGKHYRVQGVIHLPVAEVKWREAAEKAERTTKQA
jgi:hypothetical protein